MGPSPGLHERHIRAGRYIKAIVYAATDGIIATFAIVTAGVGGHLAPAVIVMVGMADMAAEAISMAAGDYLGSRAERDLYLREEVEEWRELRERPGDERREVREILIAKGYDGKDLDDLLRLITSREQFWIDFMMAEELGLQKPEGSALPSAVVTFLSFVGGGLVPLLPYVIGGRGASFAFAAIATGMALFAVGALRIYFSRQWWLWLGAETLAIGGCAAAVAYGIGAGIRLIL